MADRFDVGGLLRPTEYARATLEGKAVELREGRSQAEATWPAVVTLVAHVEGSKETCAIFVYRTDGPDAPTGLPQLTLQSRFPICSGFSVDISLPQIAPSTTPATSPYTTIAQEQELSLDIHEKGEVIFRLHTPQKESLSNFIRLCQAYQEVSGHYDKDSLPWLIPYNWQPSSWLSVQPPRDLRYTSRPLHSRLSASYAGMTPEDPTDFLLLRNNWLYTRPKAKLSEHAGQYTLKIRVGTFNVNGQLPSQDLSAWVDSNAPAPSDLEKKYKLETLIPPLADMSPLSISELSKGQADSLDSSLDEDSDTPRVEQASSAPTSSRITVQGTAENSDFDPDLLVLGFEELDLSAGALVAGAGTAREEAWTTAVYASLGRKSEQYEKLASKQLVGMLMMILVKRELKGRFMCRSGAAGAGLLGVMGNKGAVALRLTYKPPSTSSASSPVPVALTFVNAHLAAFDEMLDRRNSDFREISRKLEFGPCTEYISPSADDSPRTAAPMLNVYSSDLLIWMGDLNYRIDLPSSDIRQILCTQSVEDAATTLQAFDQLNISIQAGKAFEGFIEQPISFLPTYRFSQALLVDSLDYDMKRKPAWTDRVLYMASELVSLRQLAYTSHPSIMFSDHRPVAANFVAKIPAVDAMALDLAANELIQAVADIDPEDLSNLPSLVLDSVVFDLGDVSYDTSVVRTLTVSNVGSIPAAFRFLPRAPDRPAYPAWMSIEPMTGFLLPSEKSNITLTVHVTSAVAEPFNLRTENLVSTLILHTVLGKDHFITLSGNYLPTCFGNNFRTLARLSKPIRLSAALVQDAQAIHAPREISLLVTWLLSSKIESINDLFVAPSDLELVARIREALDAGADLPESTSSTGDDDVRMARAIGATLLMLLASMPEPLVPRVLHARCAEARDREAAFAVLANLPPASVNAWLAITSCLHLFCFSDPTHANSEPNDDMVEAARQPSRAERIATVWAPVLLRDERQSSGASTPPVSILDKRRFVMLFVDPSR